MKALPYSRIVHCLVALATALGLAAFWLGRRLNALHLWRALDGAVALMMWGTAAFLLKSLF